MRKAFAWLPLLVSFALLLPALVATAQTKPRARDLGVPFDGTPGPLNAITDVAGVEVGHPTLITNTHSVGVARDAVIAWRVKHGQMNQPWSLPVVAETWDGYLNDINGFHVKAEHVFEALDTARSGPVVEGNVGGGTGMVCHEFKGGIGTASRKLAQERGGYTVGVLVQCNYGLRRLLRVAGVPVGREITDHLVKKDETGAIIIAFSTANPGAAAPTGMASLAMLPNEEMNPLFEATVEATEEAVINALVAAETMIGIDNHQVIALPHDRLQQVL